MSLVRIDFSREFADHLRALGISGAPAGAHLVHEASFFEPPVDLRHGFVWDAPVAIGAFTYLAPDAFLTSACIGRYCSVAKLVQIGLSTHPVDRLTTSPVSWLALREFDGHFEGLDPAWRRTLPLAGFEDRPFTEIGNDVWIGANAWLKDGISVGDGAIIAAHAVVTKDVPPYAIVAGSPARVIRMRFADALIERLLAAQWWNYNLLDLDLDLTDPARCLDVIGERAASGAIAPYATEPVNLAAEYRRFRKIQRMLARHAA